MRGREWPDILVAVGLASLAVGPVWVGIIGTGVPPRVAAALAVILLSAVAWIAAPALQPVSGFLSERPWHATAGAAVLLLAAVATFKLSLFIHDPQQRGWSVRPQSDFYVGHCCLLGPTEAVARARRGESAYVVSSPSEAVDPALETDAFLYSPAFLLVPRALTLIGNDFAQLRRVWFAVQAITTLAALLWVATYVRGEYGARVVWLIPLFCLTPPFLLNLQIGNVQVTVLAAAVVGAGLLYSGRAATGSALLALAIVAKLFPVVLVAYLLGQRRWRWVAYTLGWCVLFTVASVALFGLRPVRDYLDVLPAISNGSWPGTALWTSNLGLAPSNQSIYGATRKLVALGVDFITPQVEGGVQAVYGMAVIVFAALAGAVTRSVQDDEHTRLGSVIVWLALLNLGSFRSPFLPDGYAYVGTLWLLTLLYAARRHTTWRDTLALVAAWSVLTQIFGGEDTVPQPFKVFVAFTLLTQGLVMAGTIGAIWMGCRAFLGGRHRALAPEALQRRLA